MMLYLFSSMKRSWLFTFFISKFLLLMRRLNWWIYAFLQSWLQVWNSLSSFKIVFILQLSLILILWNCKHELIFNFRGVLHLSVLWLLVHNFRVIMILHLASLSKRNLSFKVHWKWRWSSMRWDFLQVLFVLGYIWWCFKEVLILIWSLLILLFCSFEIDTAVFSFYHFNIRLSYSERRTWMKRIIMDRVSL